MKILNVYDKENQLDKAWFDSSNILYAECKDNKNDFKTVTVVFSTGSKYVYYDVNVNDWIKFREATSQGKALKEFITKKNMETNKPLYEYRRLEDANTKLINEEYIKLTHKNNDYNINKTQLKILLSNTLYNILQFDMDKKTVDNITNNLINDIESIAKEHNNKINISFE